MTLMGCSERRIAWQARRANGLLILAALAFTSLATRPAIADDSSVDPTKWCAEVTDLLISHRIDDLPEFVSNASHGGLNPSSLLGLLQLKPITESGPVTMNQMLADKDYNNTLRKIWRLVMFKNNPIFLRCTFYHDGTGWQFFHLKADTDINDVDLP